MIEEQRASSPWTFQASVELFQPRMLDKLSLQHHRILANRQYPRLVLVNSYPSYRMMGPDMNLVNFLMRQRWNRFAVDEDLYCG